MPEETTPLLSGDEPEAPSPDPERVEEAPIVIAAPLESREYFKRPIKILTRCSLIISVVSAIVLLAAFISVANGPFDYYTYMAQRTIGPLGGLVSQPSLKNSF